MVRVRDITQGGEHTLQDTGDVSQNCAPETYIILLTNATPINSITKFNIKIPSACH